MDNFALLVNRVWMCGIILLLISRQACFALDAKDHRSTLESLFNLVTPGIPRQLKIVGSIKTSSSRTNSEAIAKQYTAMLKATEGADQHLSPERQAELRHFRKRAAEQSLSNVEWRCVRERYYDRNYRIDRSTTTKRYLEPVVIESVPWECSTANIELTNQYSASGYIEFPGAASVTLLTPKDTRVGELGLWSAIYFEEEVWEPLLWTIARTDNLSSKLVQRPIRGVHGFLELDPSRLEELISGNATNMSLSISKDRHGDIDVIAIGLDYSIQVGPRIVEKVRCKYLLDGDAPNRLIKFQSDKQISQISYLSERSNFNNTDSPSTWIQKWTTRDEVRVRECVIHSMKEGPVFDYQTIFDVGRERFPQHFLVTSGYGDQFKVLQNPTGAKVLSATNRQSSRIKRFSILGSLIVLSAATLTYVIRTRGS